MKKQFLQSAAVISFVALSSAVGSPAMAAPPPPVYSWSGLYVGANGGYSWGHGSVVVGDPGLTSNTEGTIPGGSGRLNGGVGGFQGGYNWQFNSSWVGEIEADFQFSGEKNTTNFSFPYGDGEGIAGTLSSKISWFGTYRSRIGYLVNPSLLVFVTSGLAVGKVGVSGTISNINGDCDICTWGFSQSAVKAGWAAGAGIEGLIPMTQKWSWKVEYLHIDLGTLSGVAFDPDFFKNGQYSYSAKFTDDIFRFGVNYHLP